MLNRQAQKNISHQIASDNLNMPQEVWVNLNMFETSKRFY